MTPTIKHISFNEELHRYTDEDTNVYTSMTTKIKEFEVPFDRKYWSERKAKERGVSVKTILDEWDGLTKYGQDKGNIVHTSVMEDSINSGVGKLRSIGCSYINMNPVWGYEMNLETLMASRLNTKYPTIFKCIQYYVSRGFKIYAEKRIYLWEYLIAGTIDLLLVKDDCFIIVDWKTNKDELKFKSGYYKKWKGMKTNIWVDKDDRMLKPLDHIQQCKGSTYTLQLSGYAYMCEMWGYKCLGLILYHMQETDIDHVRQDSLSMAPITCYNIPYWKNEVKKMFEYKSVKHHDPIYKRSSMPRLSSKLL